MTTTTSSACDPAPGLADLPGLVAAFRASGLDVDLDVPEPLAAATRGRRRLGVPHRPGGADQRAALRVGPHRATEVQATPREVSIRGEQPERGHDAVAVPGWDSWDVAERVTLLGGQLTHGLRDGRFELHASLPVGAP